MSGSGGYGAKFTQYGGLKKMGAHSGIGIVLLISLLPCLAQYQEGMRPPPGVPPQQYAQQMGGQQMQQQQMPQQQMHMQQQQQQVHMQQQVPVQHVQMQQQVPMQQVPVQMQHQQVPVQHAAHQQQLLNAANIAQEKDHIKEHLEVPMDTSKMTEQELQFHYFKMHDADNNNKLDGCELIKSLIHWHEQGHHDPNVQAAGQHPQPKIFQDEEVAQLIDPILDMDDVNRDGFIDYPEFVRAQQKAAASHA